MHEIYGAISVGIGLIGFGLYFKSIYDGHTKPHVFTWASFALLDGIVFAAQVVKGAGPGAWAIGLGAVLCSAVAITALRVGHVRITKSDYIAFSGALLGILLWVFTSDPLWAVVLAAVVNMIAIVPTIRKTYVAPETESPTIWSIDMFRYLLSLFALASFNLTTALFPATIVFGNALVVATVLLRRRALKR